MQAGKQFELMRSDKHKSFLEKHGKDPASARPDITHQVLLAGLLYSACLHYHLSPWLLLRVMFVHVCMSAPLPMVHHAVPTDVAG